VLRFAKHVFHSSHAIFVLHWDTANSIMFFWTLSRMNGSGKLKMAALNRKWTRQNDYIQHVCIPADSVHPSHHPMIARTYHLFSLAATLLLCPGLWPARVDVCTHRTRGGVPCTMLLLFGLYRPLVKRDVERDAAYIVDCACMPLPRAALGAHS